jgi:hypothetical protein
MQVPAALERLVSADLDRFLGGLDLASVSDEVLRAARIRLAPGVRLLEEATPGSPASSDARLRFDEGVAVDQELSPAALALMEAVISSGRVTDVIDDYARRCRATPDVVAPRVLTALREGLARAVYAPEHRSPEDSEV